MAHLPENPDLNQLRRRARELQRAVRSGLPSALAAVEATAAAPDYPLTAAQLVVARDHGFVSWPRLVRHVEAISARTWRHTRDEADSPSARLVRLACLDYADGPLDRMCADAELARHPDLVRTDLALAAVAGDVDSVRHLLSSNSSAATCPTGPRGWSPLMYLAYGRVATDRDACLAVAALLLDAGADPNDGRHFAGLPTPFTVLTGVLGGGELDQPAHEHAIPLARLVLERGAEPNDGQALYNRMFGTDDDAYSLLFEFGLGRGDGGPWRAGLPDLLPTPGALVAGVFQWAVEHDQRDRVEMFLAHGSSPTAPMPGGWTPVELAARNGHAALVDRLTAAGGARPELSVEDAFVSAVLSGDVAAVDATDPAVIDTVRRTRPAVLVRAAAHGRLDAIEVLARNGFDLDALGRGDTDIDQPWETALHTAVQRDDAAMVTRLLALGADPTVRDLRFDSTPVHWAHHLGRDDLVELFDHTD